MHDSIWYRLGKLPSAIASCHDYTPQFFHPLAFPLLHRLRVSSSTHSCTVDMHVLELGRGNHHIRSLEGSGLICTFVGQEILALRGTSQPWHGIAGINHPYIHRGCTTRESIG